jgi:hypothetical protein
MQQPGSYAGLRTQAPGPLVPAVGHRVLGPEVVVVAAEPDRLASGGHPVALLAVEGVGTFPGGEQPAGVVRPPRHPPQALVGLRIVAREQGGLEGPAGALEVPELKGRPAGSHQALGHVVSGLVGHTGRKVVAAGQGRSNGEHMRHGPEAAQLSLGSAGAGWASHPLH